MIPVHMEPKGLAPDAKPISGKWAQIWFHNDAVAGSRRLRDAVLCSLGIVPPDDGPPPIVRLPAKHSDVPKAKKHKCCPLCGSSQWQRPRHIFVAHIQAEVAEFYGLPVSEMTSRRQSRDVSHPRQVAIFFARELTNKSIQEIGRRFDRDHSTVRSAIAAVERRIVNDPEIALVVERIRERLAL